MENITTNKTIDSREIAEMMEVKHYQILEKLKGTKTVKGIIPILTDHKIMVSEYFTPSTYKDDSGKENKCYLCTKLGCEFLGNKFTGEKGILFTAKYVKRFNDMEQQLSDPIQNYLSMSEEDKAIAYFTKLKETKKLQIENNANKAKVIFADSVVASKTTILIGELAKILKQNGTDIGQNRLFAWMRENGYLIRRKGVDYNMPTQKAMDLRIFEVKETSITHSDGHITINKTTKVTGKGQVYFVNKFESEAK